MGQVEKLTSEDVFLQCGLLGRRDRARVLFLEQLADSIFRPLLRDAVTATPAQTVGSP